MSDDTTPLNGNDLPDDGMAVGPPVDPPTDGFPREGLPADDASVDAPVSDELPPSTPAKKGNVGKMIGVLAGVAVIVLAGVFAYAQLSGPKSNTPEDAVKDMLTAVAKGDVIGMAEALAPGERDVMIESFVPMIEEMRRLGVFDTSLDLKSVSGINGSLVGFKATSTKLRDDLAAVRITDGTFTTRFDPSKLPLGRLIRDNLEKEIDQAGSQKTVSKLKMPVDGTRIVVIKDGGRWYFSSGYSIAEASRRDSANPGKFRFAIPAKGAGVAAKGADTPEAAVKQLIDATAKLDVRRIIEIMPPKELGALHDYAGQFIGDAEEAVKTATKDQYELSFPGMQLASKRDGDTALVTIVSTGINFGLTAPDAPEFRAIYENKNRCVTLTLDGDTKKRCGADVVKFLDDFGVPVDQAQIEDQLKLQGVNGKKPRIGFTTVKQDGKWFVSPTRTVLDGMTAYLRIISKDDVAKYEKQIKDTISGLGGGSTTAADPSLGDPTFDTGDSSDTTFAPDTTSAPDTVAADTTTAPTESRLADTIA